MNVKIEDSWKAHIGEEFDKQYRVFVGVETGAPRRHKDDADKAQNAEGLMEQQHADDAGRHGLGAGKDRHLAAVAPAQGQREAQI